jgi:uncharacterized protein YcbX
MSAPPITLAQIWVYPIKSLGGVRVARAAVTEAGSLRLDREWVVVDTAGHKLWQGDLPRMALTRCSLDAAAITVTAPGMAPLVVPRRHDGPACRISMYKHAFEGVDAGEEAAAWLSEALGRAVRLVRIGAGAHGWPGLNPVHVVSLASLTALNVRLALIGEPPVELERFRPSLVLDGGDQPAFFEEQYEAIRFGAAELIYREPCVRCQLPNISRLDASRQRQPLKLIGGMSRNRPTAAPAAFGIYARLAGAAEIAERCHGTPMRQRRVAMAG